jgi:hypothetical protein
VLEQDFRLGRTVLSTPLRESYPLVMSGHIKQIPNKRKTLRSRGQNMTRSCAVDDQDKDKDDRQEANVGGCKRLDKRQVKHDIREYVGMRMGKNVATNINGRARRGRVQPRELHRDIQQQAYLKYERTRPMKTRWKPREI